jgi:hypothetical protein
MRRVIRRKLINWYLAAEGGQRGVWIARALRWKITVRAPGLLRLAGFAVGPPKKKRAFVARRDCRVDVMHLPAGARSLATGQPVEAVSLSPLGWTRVVILRLAGRL